MYEKEKRMKVALAGVNSRGGGLPNTREQEVGAYTPSYILLVMQLFFIV